MTLATISPQHIIPSAQETRDYAESLELLYTGLSANSRKSYKTTHKLWKAWCKDNGFNTLDLSPQNITAFLDNEKWSFNTRKARLAHLRRFLKALHSAMTDNPLVSKWIAQMSEFIKPKNIGGAKDIRIKKALTRTETKDVMSVWLGDSNKAYRNQAIISILFHSGLRRFEMCALQWESIDLETGVIRTVAKGGQIKETVMLDGLSFVRDWKARQSTYGDYQYISTPVNKGDNIVSDTPMSTMSMSRTIKKTSDLSGVDFKPHDARRTVITNLLDNGMAVHEVQKIARHNQASTTLLYAQTSDIKDIAARAKNKLGYVPVSRNKALDDNAEYQCGECGQLAMITPTEDSECPFCNARDWIHLNY